MTDSSTALRLPRRPVHHWSTVEGRVRFRGSRHSKGRTFVASHKRTHGAEVAALGLMLIALQVMDALLTGIGMMQMGHHMEGNLLLRSLMTQIGTIPALVLVKSVAVATIAGLCLFAYQIRWMKTALRAVVALYLTLAIIPWSVILSTKLFF